MASIERFMAWLGKLLGWDATTPPEAPKLPQDETLPVNPPSMTNAERLYETALASLGKDMSPADHAPDSLACMESVDGVWLAAFGIHLLSPADRLSTELGYKAMLVDSRLRMIDTPEVGCIVISPTGFSTKGASHGHVGCWGKFDVMSNDSNSGLWTDNYTHEAWYDVFQKKLGFPVLFFLPV